MSKLQRMIDKFTQELDTLSAAIRTEHTRLDKLQDGILPELMGCKQAASALVGSSDFQCQIAVTNYNNGTTYFLETDTLDEFVKSVDLIIEHARELENADDNGEKYYKDITKDPPHGMYDSDIFDRFWLERAIDEGDVIEITKEEYDIIREAE